MPNHNPNRSSAPNMRLLMLLLIVAAQAPARAQYDLSWRTVDGGGFTFSTGGPYQLGGTIGQPDAGPTPLGMTGGAYTIVGGFWPGAGDVCPLPGDMNLDGLRDGVDIQGFVNCLLATGVNCPCADVDGSGTITTADVSVFVSMLLS